MTRTQHVYHLTVRVGVWAESGDAARRSLVNHLAASYKDCAYVDDQVDVKDGRLVQAPSAPGVGVYTGATTVTNTCYQCGKIGHCNCRITPSAVASKK